MFPRLYRRLLRLYPARFREEYASEMERQLRDEYRETRNRGQRVALALHTLRDLATTLPGQRAREIASDLKHSVRVYRRRKASVTLAIAALALAIGSATGIFSVLNALLLRGLPCRDSARLVELWLSPFTALKGRNAFYAWSHDSSYLSSAATFSVSEMNLARSTESYRVKATESSANLFALLGVSPALGRTFSPEEDILGHNGVAVISYTLWQQLYAGDPAALGGTLRLNGHPFTIAGVAPPRFDYPAGTRIWVPTVFDIEKIPKRGAFWFETIGRLRPGLAFGTAQRMFRAEISRAEPAALKRDPLNRPRLVSIRNQLAGPVREASWALAGMALLLVLAACANVAHVLLARNNERRSEFAIRAALGASSARLSQQRTTEAFALTFVSAVLGLLLARWVAHIAFSFLPPALASQQYTVLDARVLAFAVVLALITGLVLGALPGTLRVRSLAEHLRTQTPDNIPGSHARFLLIALQTCLAIVLVFGALSLGRAFVRLARADLGFRTEKIVTASVSLQGAGLPNSAAEWQYYSQALQRLRSVPGVTAAGAVSYLPLADNFYMAGDFTLDSGQRVARVITNAVLPGYFDAIGTRLLGGRDFTFREQRDTEKPVIVNEAFAQRSGLGSLILGRHIKAPWSRAPYVVIGVVQTERLGGPQDDAEPQIFWPIQEEPPAALTFVARIAGQPEVYLARCRDAIRATDPRVAVYDVKTLEQRRDEVLAKPRFYTTAMLFLGLVALLLAAAGVYGTALYVIAQRKREMGIRMALGASYRTLRGTLLRQSALPVAAGLLCGIPAALGCARFLSHLIFEANAPAATTLIGACVVLLAVAVLAAWRAGARVLAIDPLEAIRAE